MRFRIGRAAPRLSQAMNKAAVQLRLVSSQPGRKRDALVTANTELVTLDLFCGAGGITEGFRQAGYTCLYGNDCIVEAIETFSYNHRKAWGDVRDIEEVDPAEVRKRLGLQRGALDVLVGGRLVRVFPSTLPNAFWKTRVTDSLETMCDSSKSSSRKPFCLRTYPA